MLTFKMNDFNSDINNYLKFIEQSMINNIKNVLMEFGNGFSFVGNQYKISTSDNDYYIDLLF